MTAKKKTDCEKCDTASSDFAGTEIIICTIQKLRAIRLEDGNYKFNPVGEPVNGDQIVCKLCGGPEKVIEFVKSLEARK
jgi:hypothetical protein